VVGGLFYAAAVVRWLVGRDGEKSEAMGPAGQVAQLVAVIGLAVALMLIGTAPGLFVSGVDGSAAPSLAGLLSGPGLSGWMLWVVVVLGGGFAAWMDLGVRPRIALWLDAVHDVVLLDWCYEWLVGAAEQGFGLLRVLDSVLGGRGALIWSCVLVLILLLIGEW